MNEDAIQTKLATILTELLKKFIETTETLIEYPVMIKRTLVISKMLLLNNDKEKEFTSMKK